MKALVCGLALCILLFLTEATEPHAIESPRADFLIKHIVVITRENHSFDNYFGTYPGANGPTSETALPKAPNSTEVIRPYHLRTSTPPQDLCHRWDCAHREYNSGKMDGFVYVAGTNLTIGYYDYRDIASYWEYASHYVLLDNYFSSVMGPSLPNYLYLFAGQSGGVVRDSSNVNLDFPTIIEQLDARSISWKSYTSDGRRL